MVLKDGCYVVIKEILYILIEDVIMFMLGMFFVKQWVKKLVEFGNEFLYVEVLFFLGCFLNIFFYVKEGEVVGIVGFVGVGKMEFC